MTEQEFMESLRERDKPDDMPWVVYVCAAVGAVIGACLGGTILYMLCGVCRVH